MKFNPLQVPQSTVTKAINMEPSQAAPATSPDKPNKVINEETDVICGNGELKDWRFENARKNF